MNFRELPKESLGIQVPIEIAGVIRERAARDRRSVSATASELICVGLGIDPREYGLEPRTLVRVTEPVG